MNRKLTALIVTGLVANLPCFLSAQQSTAAPADAPKPKPIVNSVNTPAAPVAPDTLPDGTPIKLRLGRTISSADAKVGEEVDFEVLEDVKVHDVIVVPKGALALATVTTAEHKKSMGRGGKLDVNIDSVRLADGEKAALRATEGGKGGGHVGAMTGAMVATGILFFPAAPLFLFVHGKDITIPKGTEVTAYVSGDIALDMGRFVPSMAGAHGAFTMAIDSNVANCDIEVDGAFMGNTPSEVTVSAGKHSIAIKKKGYGTWTRTLTISGSGVHLNAEMQAEKISAAN